MHIWYTHDKEMNAKPIFTQTLTDSNKPHFTIRGAFYYLNLIYPTSSTI